MDYETKETAKELAVKAWAIVDPIGHAIYDVFSKRRQRREREAIMERLENLKRWEDSMKAGLDICVPQMNKYDPLLIELLKVYGYNDILDRIEAEGRL